MRFAVTKITASDWDAHCASRAHLAVFDERLPAGYDKIDFALLALADDKPVAYLTARVLDSDTVYLKRGGAFDVLEKCMRLPAYLDMLHWLDGHYKQMTTLVENGNVNYLKLAMAAGFRVIGIRNFEGSILLELLRKKGV